MAASKLKQDETRVRRTKLLALRRQGIRYDDERILALGYASDGAARRDLSRALEQHRDEEAAEVGIYRQQENERLDALLEAAWPQATKPQPVLDKEGEVVAMTVDMRAVDTVLRLMDRRAKLNGLDMPAKTEVSGPDGGAIPFSGSDLSELAALIAIADQEHAELPVVDHDDDEDAGGDGNA
ncbi:hypothetical protein ACGFNY_43860 [Streptomyces chartreusis]|uniref:hypothetical protein n=1 Tax=Streptomyces chartreusis TaxID=1969 RepID=UPI0037146A96